MMMTALASSFAPARINSQSQFSSGSSLIQADRYVSSTSLSISPRGTGKPLKKGKLIVRAGGDDSRSSGAASAGLFVGGFLLGGIVVGTLGCVYAPQISKALTGEDRKELMRKLPKFIYDEEKALERNRKVLTEKIQQLNSAIDDATNQLRKDNPQNNGSTSSDELEATI